MNGCAESIVSGALGCVIGLLLAFWIWWACCRVARARRLRRVERVFDASSGPIVRDGNLFGGAP